MPLGILRRASALTSGTTSGTSGSMRQALLLSMTIAPALAAIGLVSRLTDAGVLLRTMSTPTNASGRMASTGYDLPLKTRGLPALRSEARNLMARKGNECSSSTCRMTSPTAPVAPTTATLGNTPGTLSCQRKEKPIHPVIEAGRRFGKRIMTALECGGSTPLWMERRRLHPKRRRAAALQSQIQRQVENCDRHRKDVPRRERRREAILRVGENFRKKPSVAFDRTNFAT